MFRFLVLNYLRLGARIKLAQLGCKVVAVGGASGKTSTATAIVAALQTRYRVRNGAGKNSESGVPLGILDISMTSYSLWGWLKVCLLVPLRLIFDWREVDIFVAEYGIDKPGDMDYLLSIATPDVALLTNIAIEHTAFFEQEEGDSKEELLERIAQEELKLLRAVPEDGVIIAYSDDKKITHILDELDTTILYAGKSEQNDYQLTTYKPTQEDTTVEIYHDGITYPSVLSLPITEASASSILLAVATAHELGVPIQESFKAIDAVWQVPPGRGKVFRGKKETLLIDSSYNATPIAMHDALHFLDSLSNKRRRVAILGDMRELGSLTGYVHEELVEPIKQYTDMILVVGPAMNEYLVPKLEKEDISFLAFASVEELKKSLLEKIQPKDVVLIKGSQNTLFLEQVTEMLLQDEKQVKMLCRRGEYWDKERA